MEDVGEGCLVLYFGRGSLAVLCQWIGKGHLENGDMSVHSFVHLLTN